ncbi:iron-sulfur cluster assembly protein [Thermococcus sp. SY098]|uniref:iron-sulfur cluster assembly protein n=1 Tax=Thermococcus sp. SY098 TaxID=3111325 RepID=UPI002D79E449|nr:iron-sulfur cluster assembly protein [Thermococcus sp. SY098]WRS52520.1 iron-sulfur cluster assembly protein [Thermococcus sp. SY098]
MKIDRIYELLKTVKEPISGENIVKLGIVSKIVKDNGKIVIYLDLARRTPQSPFEMAITWTVHAKIVREIVKVLEDKIPEFEIIDSMTLQRYYPLEEV